MLAAAPWVLALAHMHMHAWLVRRLVSLHSIAARTAFAAAPLQMLGPALPRMTNKLLLHAQRCYWVRAKA